MIRTLFFLFIVSVSLLCIREGIRGILLRQCRVPFQHKHDSIGYGVEAVVWGGAYLAIGMLYLYFTFESVAALTLQTF